MEQFYCLSVVLNIVAGLILVYGLDLTKQPGEIVPTEIEGENKKLIPGRKLPKNLSGLNGRGLRFIIGICATLVGLIKFFSAYRGIAILGDLIPSVAGLAAGISILIEYYAANITDDDFELSDKIESLFVKPRKYIGVFCLLAALLHFLFPRAIFL